MDKKEIKPLIQPTTLKDKNVDIKDTMNFKRVVKNEKKKVKNPPKDKISERERLKTTMKTQKMSMDVLLKMDLLDPFLRNTESIDHDGKLSINDKVDILIESYIEEKLTPRQKEGFKAIYDTYLQG